MLSIKLHIHVCTLWQIYTVHVRAGYSLDIHFKYHNDLIYHSGHLATIVVEESPLIAEGALNGWNTYFFLIIYI